MVDQKVTCEHEWDVVNPCPECGTDAVPFAYRCPWVSAEIGTGTLICTLPEGHPDRHDFVDAA